MAFSALRRAAVLVLVAVAPASAIAAAPSGSRRASASAAPVEESAAERRAVRGVPVDELGAGESPELRELRRFETGAFPRGGAPSGTSPAREATEPPPSPSPAGGLPGAWAGSGDAPSELRELRAAETAPAVGTTPSATSPESEWLRGLTLPELPVRWEPQVLRYLDYFKNDPKGRQVMTNWLRRAGRFRSLFETTLVRHGMPKDLFYLAMIESGFDTGARSRVGAGGVWQFMPGAARAYGLEVSYWIDTRRDPERAVDAAARHLKDLFVRFGSWHLAFAAYNAGYGAVLKSISRYNTNDFWELCRHEAGLPWESSIYVPKILAAAIVGHNLEAFGFADVTPDAPFAFERVAAPAGTTLQTVARAANVRLDVLQALNPHLVRDRTPPDRGATEVRVPVGAAQSYADGLTAARAVSEKLDTVVLRFGETIDEVARARGVPTRELRKLNGLKDSGEARAGVTLLVPRLPAKVVAAPVVPSPPSADGGDREGSGDDDDTIMVAVPDRVFSYEGRERVFYKTRDGDALDDIGEVFGVRPDDLCEWNNVDANAKLHPNMVLQVFVRKDFDPAGILLMDASRVRVVILGSEEFLELEAARRGKKRLLYTARTGDTLAKVGRRYGLTPGDLARINRFSYNTELQDGQRIVVYSPTGDVPREVTSGMAPDSRRPKPTAATTTAAAAATAAIAATAAGSGKTSAKGGAGKAAVGTVSQPVGKTVAAKGAGARETRPVGRVAPAVGKTAGGGSGGAAAPAKKK